MIAIDVNSVKINTYMQNIILFYYLTFILRTHKKQYKDFYFKSIYNLNFLNTGPRP